MSFQPLLFSSTTTLPEPVSLSENELREIALHLLHDTDCSALAENLKVQWNSRMRTTAGLACYTTNSIILNPRLRAFGKEEIVTTLKHELAHLVAHFRNPRRRIAPHGKEWKQACRDLGLINEKRCHTLPLPRSRQTRKHFYQCGQCRLLVPRVRPFRRAMACTACCRKHNRGRYHENFRLVKLKLPPA